jgi:hypothetical protein
MPPFLWTDKSGRGRNRFVLFRKSFRLGTAPKAGLLRLFADARYRLSVNGVVLGHGPARFFHSKPEYDEHDLTAHLRPGENVLAVLAHSPGAIHYQGEESEGAFVAWGEASDTDGNQIDLSTESGWRTIDSPGHLRETHGVSFALGPAESRDLRLTPGGPAIGPDTGEGWERPGFDDSAWPDAVRRTGTAYGPLHPRSIPPLDESVLLPRACLGAFVGTDEPDEDVYSALVVPDSREVGVSPASALLTFVHSPRQQQVTFFGWWGRYFLNGEELKSHHRDEPRRRQAFTATFREGWNALLCSERFHWAAWELYLRFPRSAGLELSANSTEGSSELFLLAGPFTASDQGDRLYALLSALTSPDALPADLGPWRILPRGQHAPCPHRERAARNWSPVTAPLPTLPGEVDLTPLIGDAESIAVAYNFGTEYLGRFLIEVTAPAGTVLDVSFTESLTPDGRLDVHQRYLVDPSERFILAGGRQLLRPFHPRGGRYVELAFTPPASSREGLQLHSVALSQAAYPVSQSGTFRCSDPRLTEIWQLGATTQRICMEDAYLDCPMRERGLYVGDTLVQFFTNLASFGDTRLMRRCIELFLLSADAGDNGLVAGGAHGLPPGRHPDYSALLPWMLLAYHHHTGDLDFCRSMRTRLLRLLEGLDQTSVPGSALVDGSDLGLYIDTAPHDHAGINAPNNAFAAGAFRDGARFFRLLGSPTEADRWQDRYDRLRADFHTHFYDPARGVYLDRLKAEKPDTAPSIHGNATALLFGLVPPAERDRVEHYLLATLRHNTRSHPASHTRDFHVSSYFSFYVLTALLQSPPKDPNNDPLGTFALDFIRQNWSIYLDRGAATTWEYFSDNASLCHAWSTSPTHFLSTVVLGVTFPVPGDIQQVRIAPRPCGLHFAEGVYPHPAGPIKVRWNRQGKHLQLNYTLPRGVVAV